MPQGRMSDAAMAMDRDLALEAVRVTEAAALAASGLVGRGDEQAAEEAAIAAMGVALNGLAIDGRVVIGEEGGQSQLAAGAIIGAGGPHIEIALNALEGASTTAKGGPNALSVVALALKGGFLPVPDTYMDKIAVGPGLPQGVVELDASPAKNLASLARAKSADISDLLVCILDRPRHEELIAHVREAGARIMLIADGDVSGIIATTLPETGVDLFMGSGGAREGVLAAAAITCMGGQMQARLLLRSDSDRARARTAGLGDPTRLYLMDDLARGEVMFAATGVTSGTMLRGVRRFHAGAITHSLVVRSKSGTFRFIEAHHDFTRKSDQGLK